MPLANEAIIAFSGISSLLVAVFVYRRLTWRSRFLRWITVIALWSLSNTLIQNVSKAIYRDNFPEDKAQLIEREILRQSPLFRIVADREPALWAYTREQLALIAKVSSIETDLAQMAYNSARPIRERLVQVAYTSGDDALINLLAAEYSITAALQPASSNLCVKRLKGEFTDFDKLPQAFKDMNASVQERLRLAYLDGSRLYHPPPIEAQGNALLTKALIMPGNEFTQLEIAAFGNLDKQSPAQFCSLMNKFMANILTLPRVEGAAVYRYVYSLDKK